MKRPDTVFVRNNGKNPHRDRYDGEAFEIAPGASIEMEVAAATLCFGFGEPDKTRAIRRLGWAETQSHLPAALKRLGEFSFHTKPDQATLNRLDAPAIAAAGDEAQNASLPESPPLATGRPVNVLEKLARAGATAAG